MIEANVTVSSLLEYLQAFPPDATIKVYDLGILVIYNSKKIGELYTDDNRGYKEVLK